MLIIIRVVGTTLLRNSRTYYYFCYIRSQVNILFLLMYMWSKKRSWYPISGIEDPCNSEGLMITREIELTELEMEYVCISNNVFRN